MSSLNSVDPEIAELIKAEERRQRDTVRLIASENYVSRAVLEATGSVLTNKYSEGYPGKRYYEGQQFIDQIETLAHRRAPRRCSASSTPTCSPTPARPRTSPSTSRSCKPGDTVMGMGLPAGGHLTHGWNVSITGKYFSAVQYGVRQDTGRIDLDEVRELAREERPKLIFCGGTAIPRTIDFAAFAEIAHEVGAMLAADIAHIAGLVAGGAHPSPVGHADVVSTTTHKTLRGPRGGMLMSTTDEHAKAIDRPSSPACRAARTTTPPPASRWRCKEAATDEFKDYARQIVANAQALAEALVERGFDLVTGGTDNHLILVDLTSKGVARQARRQGARRGRPGAQLQHVPFDPRKPFDPSGIRLGTPAVTSRGMGEAEMRQIAAWIDQVVTALAKDEDEAKHVITRVHGEVSELTSHFPAPGL